MNAKHLLLGLFATATLAGCNQFKTTKTEQGDRYQLHSEGKTGKKPKDGDIITFDLLLRPATNDTLIIKDSYKEGQPIQLVLQKGPFKGSFENALYHLAEGDSATVQVVADSLYAKIQQPFPPGVTKGSDLLFTVKIRSIKSQQDFQKEMEGRKTGEGASIDAWATKNLAGATKSAEGIYSVVRKAGTGISPMKGDTVVVHYSGRLLDGKEFDSSIKRGEPITFPVGVGFVIPGWDATLMSMKAGEKRTVVIPSAMGYGDRGAGGIIEPYTPLVFDMELLDVKKAKK